MEQADIYQKLAAKWLEIAREARLPHLKRCYRSRALRYRKLAGMREGRAELQRDLRRGVAP